MRNLFLREIFQVFFPLSLLFRLTGSLFCGFDNLFPGRFRCGSIVIRLELIEKGELSRNIIQFFCLTAKTRLVHGRLDACVFPNRQHTVFQQNPAPIFRLQQELRRFPSFPHKPVVRSAVASGSSFAPGGRFHPSRVWPIVRQVSVHRSG